MRRIVISGPISIEKFESAVERNSKSKTFHSMTTADSFISKIDKNKKTLLIVKTGRLGISRGQPRFYGKYNQKANITTVVGRFDISPLQKVILFVLFSALLLIFVLSVGWEGIYTLLAIIIYYLLLFFCIQERQTQEKRLLL